MTTTPTIPTTDTDRRVLPVGFVVGAPRSGTSLLYKALCLHPDAGWISNWVRRHPTITSLAALNRLTRHTPGQRHRAWFTDGGNAYVYGRHRSVATRLYPMPVEGEPLFRACGLGVTGPRPLDPDRGREAAEVLGDRLAAVLRWGGGDVVVNKRIDHNRRIAALARALPDARFVVLVRDGRAVAASLAAVDWWADQPLWWAEGTPTTWARDGGDPWEACARHWVAETAVLEAGIATVVPERVLRIRYEELVADLVGVAGRVSRFVGLRADAVWSRQVARLDRRRPDDAWRDHLPPAARSAIERVAGDALRRYGYAG